MTSFTVRTFSDPRGWHHEHTTEALMSSEPQDATFESLRRALEEAAQEALIAEFAKLGLDYTGIHPTIRAVMERAAISTAQAKQQVESFVGVAALADRFNITEQQKQYALVKAYESYGERLGLGA